jgi:hypothetical protein
MMMMMCNGANWSFFLNRQIGEKGFVSVVKMGLVDEEDLVERRD